MHIISNSLGAAHTSSSDLRQTEAALQNLTRWLTSDQVLRPTKSGAGVANWLWPNGIHDGLYPEICGYYLQFLALAASSAVGHDSASCGEVGASAAKCAASNVVKWLDEVGPAGDPPTLDHRNPVQSDWRNKCLFAFDLGMIYRGFAAVERRWPGTVNSEIMAGYRASIRSLTCDGSLVSHSLRLGASASDIPVKWSTRIDVHHVKIAAALAGVGPEFSRVVLETIDEQGRMLLRDGSLRLRELHPFLYFVEGWLMLWGQSGSPVFLQRAVTAFNIVLSQFDHARDTLPQIAGRSDLPPRSDVLAQALRAGVILEHAGLFDGSLSSGWPVIREKLEIALLSRLTPEGGIEFDEIGHHRNIWASLFAWQALRFTNQAGTGWFDPKEAAASLI